MFCTNCGTELSGTQKFCGSCGSKVANPARRQRDLENPAPDPMNSLETPCDSRVSLVLVPPRQQSRPWFKRASVWFAVLVFLIPVSMAIRSRFVSAVPEPVFPVFADTAGVEAPEIQTDPPVEITLRESETEMTTYIGPEQTRIPLAEVPPAKAEAEPVSYNRPFVFDGLEIVFSDTIRWDYIDNEFSDHHREDVFAVPVAIKNIGRESNGLNMLYYKKYGPDGLELDDIGFYFDSDLHASGDIRAGATLTGDMYFLYNGDGDYYVEFENFLDKREVRLPVVAEV